MCVDVKMRDVIWEVIVRKKELFFFFLKRNTYFIYYEIKAKTMINVST